jgi:hypothetical protein
MDFPFFHGSDVGQFPLEPVPFLDPFSKRLLERLQPAGLIHKNFFIGVDAKFFDF